MAARFFVDSPDVRAEIRRKLEQANSDTPTRLCIRCRLKQAKPGLDHCSARCAKRDLADRQK